MLMDEVFVFCGLKLKGCGDAGEERIDWNRDIGEGDAVASGDEAGDVVDLRIALFLREMAFRLQLLGHAIGEERGSSAEMV